MIAPFSLLLLGSAALTSARPLAHRAASAPLALRTVTSLDQAATAEAQQRDNTATRAFTAQEIKSSDGKCFFVDPLSGDFRENLTPVQLVNCDGSDGQKWDVITSGKHNNVAGTALIVSSLTNACLNFDDRRAAGNQVLLFSCGGRADGGGQVTDSQLFAFDGSAGLLTLQPRNSKGTCLTVNGNLLDQASCNNSPTQTFTIGGGNAAAGSSGSNASSVSSASASSSAAVSSTSAATQSAISTASSNADVECSAVTSTVVSTSIVTVSATANNNAAVTASTTVNNNAASSSATTVSSATVTASATVNNNAAIPSENPTQTVPVSRAGGVLNPTAAAEANTRDDTATRAFSDVSLKSADGRCLFIDPTAGDFRENLIPVQLKECDGSANEKFDIITAGKHNNAKNSMLIVSTLMQGCLNFDSRRAAGDTVIMFSCGGRADGEGQTTDSQLFPFTGEKSILLAPENGKNATCLVPKGNLLDQANCSGGADQLFTIV